jgi:hypothetical protein
MKISDIVLSKDVEAELLKKNGYVSETILVKYPLSYYAEPRDDDWRYMKTDIAYLEGKRPKWADDVPSILEIRENMYDYVLGKIVEEKLSQLLLT